MKESFVQCTTSAFALHVHCTYTCIIVYMMKHKSALNTHLHFHVSLEFKEHLHWLHEASSCRTVKSSAPVRHRVHGARESGQKLSENPHLTQRGGHDHSCTVTLLQHGLETIHEVFIGVFLDPFSNCTWGG